ncbi:Uncharacterised protein [uncultured archaeon]|nr:Uncharacterised protein [uncultured archaeon]
MAPMNYMRRLIQIVFLLFVTAALACSQVSLNGSGGLALLNSMTAGSLNLTIDSINASNQLHNMNDTSDSSSNLWSWGGKPKEHPLNYPETDYLNDSEI